MIESLRHAIEHTLHRVTVMLAPSRAGDVFPLPPVARYALPTATAEEAITYNRARKALPIALSLLRNGDTDNCTDSTVEAAACALGWIEVSGETIAAVRADLGVLRADESLYVARSRY